MAHKPDISVILPVFNAGRFLPDAIRSVLEQSFENFELIVVNDGSTDDSLEIAKNAAADDSRMSIENNPGQGLVDALNAGLELARAPLVARMDADDISLPHRLAKQKELFDSCGAGDAPDVVSCLVQSFPEEPGAEVGEGMLVYEQWLNSLVKHEDLQRDFFVESPIAHPSVMFRKDRVAALGGYRDFGWPEDYDLWMRLFLSGARFEKVPEKLFMWRDGVDRLSRTASEYSQVAFRKLKAHFLLKGPLAGRDEVVIAGAGRTGRWWCRELTISGLRVEKFIDADPAKIGGSVGAIPIVSPSEAGEPGDLPLILCCVGSRGARDVIRKHFVESGFVELRDFLFIA